MSLKDSIPEPLQAFQKGWPKFCKNKARFNFLWKTMFSLWGKGRALRQFKGVRSTAETGPQYFDLFGNLSPS